MKESFVDREAELAVLERAWNSDRAEFLAVFGRRRVGKTALLRQFALDKPGAFYVATLSSPATLLRQFTRAIEGDDAAFSYDDWAAAFRSLARQAGTGRRLVVIDEFPYLVAAVPGVSSVLQAVWDEVLEGSKIMLVLCGSHTGMMEREVVAYRAPLYGRRTGQVRLGPLPPWGTAAMLPGRGIAEVVEAVAAFGGVPAYLRLANEGEHVVDTLERVVLDLNGVLHMEPQFLLREEVYEPRSYFALLQSIAAGNTRLNEIAQGAGIERGPASRYLATLQELGIVKRVVPVTESRPEKSRKGMYKIADGLLRFWFTYVAPNESILASGNTAAVRAKVEATWAGFVAPVFEELCREWVARRVAEGSIGFEPRAIGSWWVRDAEIDVVAIGDHGAMLGECKWTAKPVGIDVLATLRQRAARFAGEVGPETAGFLDGPRLALFAKSGFTPELETVAQREGVMLVTAEEVVAP